MAQHAGSQHLVTAFMFLQALTHEALSHSRLLVPMCLPTTVTPMALLLFQIHHDQEAKNIRVTRIVCKTRDNGYENKDVPVREFTDNNIWMLRILTQAGWDPPSLIPWQPPAPLCTTFQTTQAWGAWPCSSPSPQPAYPNQSTQLPPLGTCWLSVFFKQETKLYPWP